MGKRSLKAHATTAVKSDTRSVIAGQKAAELQVKDPSKMLRSQMGIRRIPLTPVRNHQRNQQRQKRLQKTLKGRRRRRTRKNTLHIMYAIRRNIMRVNV